MGEHRLFEPRQHAEGRGDGDTDDDHPSQTVRRGRVRQGGSGDDLGLDFHVFDLDPACATPEMILIHQRPKIYHNGGLNP